MNAASASPQPQPQPEPQPEPRLHPGTKTARHGHIRRLLGRRPVRSQAELAAMLAEDGMAVTQATLSRDLVEIGAAKVRDPRHGMVYAVPGEGGDRSLQPVVSPVESDARLARLCEELLVTAESSANLVVLRTPPGAAQFLASAVDQSGVAGVLGTIAGDDTVLVISRAPDGGPALAERFLQLAGNRGEPVP